MFWFLFWIHEFEQQSENLTIIVILQSIPRVVWLSSSGKQLVQWPIQEIESLRKNKVEIQHKELKSGSMFEVVGITAAQVTIMQITASFVSF